MANPTSLKELLGWLYQTYGVNQILGLDFETYYDKDYTLTKLSTTEYVRHEQFKAHSCAFQLHTRKTAVGVRDEELEDYLAGIHWDRTAILCHHTHFDGSILTHHYKAKPRFYLDTLSMARPLHGGEINNDLDTVAAYYGAGNKLPNLLGETKGVRTLPPALMNKLLRYNKNDVVITWKIFLAMLALGEFSFDEFRLIDHTVRAYAEPVLQVNKALAKRAHAAEVKERRETVERTGEDTKTLRSREKFAQLLRDQGAEPPMKISPTTGNETYAFAKNDLAFQELKQHPSEAVRNLVEARLICSSSIEETRALRLLSHSAAGPLPIYLKYGGAHTLRWSGGDKMNPQNFKRKSPLREAIRAPAGHVLIVFDSGQIEARVNGWLAKQDDLIAQFRAKDAGDKTQDPYKIMASVLFDKPYDEVTDIERFVGKTCILGLGYQMGAPKLHYTLISGSQGPVVECTIEEASQWVLRYRETNNKIVGQWKFMQEEALPTMGGFLEQELEYGPIVFKKGGYLSPNGMFMRYPGLKPGFINRPTKTSGFRAKTAAPAKVTFDDWTYKDGNVHLYGGKTTENIVQNLARHVVAHQILQASERYRLVLQVHDEGVWCVPRREAKRAFEVIKEAFHTPPSWAADLPVMGEGVISTVYEKP